MIFSKVVHRLALCLFVLSVQVASAGSLTEGLVGHWALDEIQGDRIKDLSGKGYDATGANVEVVDGRGGKVFAFDGKFSEVFLPDEPVFEVTGDYSVSFWVRVPAESWKGGAIYAQPGFVIADFRGSLRITFRHSEYPNTGYADMMGPRINDGEWHHVVLSYEAKTGETLLFLDAQEVAKREFPHKPEVSMPTTVGFAGRGHFEGELSDLRVYTRPLGYSDVSALNSAKVVP